MSDSFLTGYTTLTLADVYEEYEDEEMDEDDFEDFFQDDFEDDEIPRKSPLCWAVQNSHTDIVRLLLSREDIYPDLPDSEGQSPLYLACKSGNEEVVRLLLERGVAVDPNLQEPRRSFSPLIVAAFHAHEGVVKLLLTRNDIYPNIRSHSGQTALSIAAGRGHSGVLKLLLAWGPIDLNSTDSLHGRSALSHATCVKATRAWSSFSWPARALNRTKLTSMAKQHWPLLRRGDISIL